MAGLSRKELKILGYSVPTYGQRLTCMRVRRNGHSRQHYSAILQY